MTKYEEAGGEAATVTTVGRLFYTVQLAKLRERANERMLERGILSFS